MRLVAWNANYNVRKRTLEEDVELLAPFDADILVISETAPPTASNPLSAYFVGDCPGLAVVVRDGAELEPLPDNDGAPTLMMGFRVKRPAEINLLAVWPVSRHGDPSYHRVLMAGLDRYHGLLSGDRAIMIGDLNSSSRVTAQRSTHPRFVEAASELGLTSLYHAQTSEAHGQESQATYVHAPGQEFYLDYCFVSDALLSGAVMAIERDKYWSGLSDHFPLVVDL